MRNRHWFYHKKSDRCQLQQLQALLQIIQDGGCRILSFGHGKEEMEFCLHLYRIVGISTSYYRLLIQKDDNSII